MPRSWLNYVPPHPLLYGKGSFVNAPPKIKHGRYTCVPTIQILISSGDPNDQD